MLYADENPNLPPPSTKLSPTETLISGSRIRAGAVTCNREGDLRDEAR